MSVIVVDANVFVSALLKDSTTRKILLSANAPSFFTPDFVETEIMKYAGEFSKRLGKSEKQVMSSLKELFEASKTRVVSEKEYFGLLDKALEITPDIKDAPYLALALKLRCPLWSQDADLKEQSLVKVFSTGELIKELS